MSCAQGVSSFRSLKIQQLAVSDQHSVELVEMLRPSADRTVKTRKSGWKLNRIGRLKNG